MTVKFSAAETADPDYSEVSRLLRSISGDGLLQDQIGEILSWLKKVRPRYWQGPQASGRIKRFAYRAQVPNEREIADIRAAFVLAAPILIDRNKKALDVLLADLDRISPISQPVPREPFNQEQGELKCR